MITLRQLRYLSALAKHGHFGRAAEACAVTQPALSMQIRDLERTLGVAVVERRPNEVRLTEVGREIARRGEDMLAASRDLVDFARHSSGLLMGRLTLGVIPSLAPYLLPRILPVLQARFPELRLELRETQTRQLVDLTALIAAQSRAQSLEGARLTANQEQGRVQLQQFLSTSRGYQPQTVQMFHQ